MTANSNKFPITLSQLHQLEFDYADGEGIDFEPYEEFLSASETSDWFQAWTGNPEADGSCFRIFGQDGTGGYAAFWVQADQANLIEQPIVFLGSEGELGVVAKNLSDYLWLLASNHGPYEAVAYPDESRPSNPDFAKFAEMKSSSPRKSISAILAEATSAYPNFTEWVRGECR